MYHSCEKDKCSSCLWKPYHSCITNISKQDCEVSKDYEWCGPKYPLRLNTMCSTPNSSVSASSCGTYKGCMWTTPQDQTTCDAAGSDYQWCGVPPVTVNCCDKTTTPWTCSIQTGTTCRTGTTQIDSCNNCTAPVTEVNCCDETSTPWSCSIQTGTTCSTGTSLIDSCNSCTAPEICANPYYGAGNVGGASCGVSTILPNNNNGLKRWLQIFPALDPSSSQYSNQQCDQFNSFRKYDWQAGCLMYGQGGMNGLTAFLNVAAQFPGFANGPDARKNIIELASFLGNVTQETGNPPYGGLIFSSEMGSPCAGSLFGKGPIQLTGAINYQMATLGLNKPSDFNNLITKQYPLADNCKLNGLLPPADPCWTQCANATPTPPPQGSGYNYCAKPWLASGVNDLSGTSQLDPMPAWASAIWYWMNAPIQTNVAKTVYNIPGDVSCATAHNLIQDPAYDCGDWCPVTAIAQVGCDSCCIKTTDTLGAMTYNRIGDFVKIAGILGLPEAQGSAANNLFCTLINTCKSGAPNSLGSTCPTGLSYQCYVNGNCGGGGTTTVPICGNVTHAAPAPSCNVIPGNAMNADQSQCDPCQTGQQFWPCNTAGACQWSSA